MVSSLLHVVRISYCGIYIHVKKNKKRKADYDDKCQKLDETQQILATRIAANLLKTPVQRRKKHSSNPVTSQITREVRQCFAPCPEAPPSKRVRRETSTPHKRVADASVQPFRKLFKGLPP